MHPQCLSSKAIRHQGKKQKPLPLCTKVACQSVWDAATASADEEMLIKIRGQDLIAREFRMHRKCYRDYTRNVSQNRRERIPGPATDGNEKVDEPNSENLQQFVQEHIIHNGRSVSLRLLTELYGFDPDDNRSRAKVKDKLQASFPGQLLYVTLDYHSAQLVISLKSVTNVDAKGFVRDNDRLCFDRVCEVLQREMDDLISAAKELPWPPTPDALRQEDRKVPQRLSNFILDLVHKRKSHHAPGAETKRFADSFAQDILFGYSGGSFLTEKHVILDTGLHSLTGQKIPVTILSRLGHCIKYDVIRVIAAGQAELARKSCDNGYQMPFVPKSDDKVVRI